MTEPVEQVVLRLDLPMTEEALRIVAKMLAIPGQSIRPSALEAEHPAGHTVRVELDPKVTWIATDDVTEIPS